jgi:two-component system CheB/CheR fusion protein
MLGSRHPEALGRSSQETFGGDGFALPLEQIWRGEAVTLVDQPGTIRRGRQLEETWFTLTQMPLRDESGQVAGVFVVAVETTDRVRGEQLQNQAEVELRATQERLNAALSAGHMATWEWDPATDQVIASATMADVFGLLPGETWQGSAQGFRLVHPEDRDRYRAMVEAAGRRGGSWHSEFRIIRPRDGQVAWLEEHARPVWDPQTGKVRLTGFVWDITERKWAEEALRQSQAKLVRELEDAKQLQTISSQLIPQANSEALYDQIVEAAMALLRSDMGSLQMVDAEHNELRLLAWKGFHPASAARWDKLSAQSPTCCGAALRAGQRVIVPDVRASELLQDWDSLQHYDLCDITALQSTPLVSRAGRLVGILSTHWRQRHEPDERELRLLDVLARQAADVLERAHNEAALRASEERFRLMIQTVQDHAIFVMDPAGNVASWNEGAQRILGYAADEVLGRPGALFFTEEDRRGGLPQRELRTAAEAGRATDENWQVRKDGSRFWASGTTTALWDEREGLSGFVKIFRDLTERKAAADALLEKDLRLRAALAAARMGTWHWDIAANRQRLDESLHRLMGLPSDRVVNTLEEFLEVVHADDRSAVARAFRRSVEQGVPLNVEFRVVWPDGSVHWLKDQGEVLPGPDGRPRFLTGACVDITDRRQMEEDLRQADRRKDEFLAMLGHELRNPLAPLRGVMEVLQRQRLDAPGLERAYAMMNRQVMHLVRLVDDLLDVSRITRGLVELRREPVDLVQVANQAVEMAAPAIEGRGHDLALTLPRKPLRVEGDPTRLTQVFFNLLSNAAKYTDPGGRIDFRVDREGDGAVIRVRDNGNGMEAELVPKVFDLFTQGERTPDRSQGGLGLGLTLVKRLVEMHGGSVQARSEGPGKGSEFTVRLPLLLQKDEGRGMRDESRKDEGGRMRDEKSREEASDRQRPLLPSSFIPHPSSLRVLVVDDSSDVAETLAWMLQGLAQEIQMVHSGLAAIQRVRQFLPDVILCDIGMPGMDGYETCRRLRQLPGLEKTLIAAVSGYGGEEERRKSKEAGFDRHLVKPIGRATLEELLGGLAGVR